MWSRTIRLESSMDLENVVRAEINSPTSEISWVLVACLDITSSWVWRTLSDQKRFSGILNPELSDSAQNSASVGKWNLGLSTQFIAIWMRWTMSRVVRMRVAVASMQVLKGSRGPFCNVTSEPLRMTERKGLFRFGRGRWMKCENYEPSLGSDGNVRTEQGLSRT